MAALSVNLWILVLLTLSGYLAISPIKASNMETLKTDSTKDSTRILDNSMNSLNTRSNGNLFGSKRNMRSIYGFGPKMLQISRSKIPIELDLLVENDDGDRSKRFDDYGHMRFGKRGGEEQFDDYGHMRFGRSA